MYKGTTPTFIFTFPEDFDPTEASKIIVTLSAKGVPVLEKTGEDLTVDETTVSVYLSQEESFRMPVGEVQAQINLLYADGSRVATNIVRIDWSRNLHNEVMA